MPWCQVRVNVVCSVAQVVVSCIPRSSIMGVLDASASTAVLICVTVSFALFLLGCLFVLFFTSNVSQELILKQVGAANEHITIAEPRKEGSAMEVWRGMCKPGIVCG